MLPQVSLSNNQLSSLPEEMGLLGNLEGLYLCHNDLTELPESIGMLANLKELTLSGNMLRELPASMQSVSYRLASISLLTECCLRCEIC